MADEWITGPALETVLFLNGIKAGDEVKVKACDDLCFTSFSNCDKADHAGVITHDEWRGDTAFVVESVDLRWGQRPRPPGRYLVRRKDMMGIFVNERNIRAWRRPHE